MSKKILTNQEMQEQTNPGGFNTALCTQAFILCNNFWPNIVKGYVYDDDTLGTIDCGTCSYMADQCGWKYVYEGTGGGVAWEDCKWICTCH